MTLGWLTSLRTIASTSASHQSAKRRRSRRPILVWVHMSKVSSITSMPSRSQASSIARLIGLWALRMALKPAVLQQLDPALVGAVDGGRAERAVVVVDAGAAEQHRLAVDAQARAGDRAASVRMPNVVPSSSTTSSPSSRVTRHV